MSALQPHLVAISETWLDNSVSDGAFLPAGYYVAVRVDRAAGTDDRGHGGGVVILCRTDVLCTPRTDLCFWRESAWIEVSLPFSCRRKLLLAVSTDPLIIQLLQ